MGLGWLASKEELARLALSEFLRHYSFEFHAGGVSLWFDYYSLPPH
jgi:hypothetical protein